MFDVGFPELMVIGIVALVVIGPEPCSASRAWLGICSAACNAYVNDVKADINREIQLDELKAQERRAGYGAQSGARAFAGGNAGGRDAVSEHVQSARSALDDLARRSADAANTETEWPPLRSVRWRKRWRATTPERPDHGKQEDIRTFELARPLDQGAAFDRHRFRPVCLGEGECTTCLRSLIATLPQGGRDDRDRMSLASSSCR